MVEEDHTEVMGKGHTEVERDAPTRERDKMLFKMSHIFARDNISSRVISTNL